MVFSTVIIVGLAGELPGDRGPGRGRARRVVLAFLVVVFFACFERFWWPI